MKSNEDIFFRLRKSEGLMYKINLVTERGSEMKPIVLLLHVSALIFILLFFSMNCSNKTKKNVSFKKRLVVKGFFIDMPVEEAYKKALAISSTLYINNHTNFFGPRQWNFNLQSKEFFYFKEYENHNLIEWKIEKAEVSEYIPFKKIVLKDSLNEFNDVKEFMLEDWSYNLTDNLDFSGWAGFQDKYRSFNLLIKKGKLNEINLKCKIFNACDMTEDGFAQEFITNYNIPKLNRDDEGNRVFESEYGYKILFEKPKKVTIVKIPSKAQRKFD